MVSRGFAWVEENVEHSDEDNARAGALAKKWSGLMTDEENRTFRRQADYDSGYDYEPDYSDLSDEEAEQAIQEDSKRELAREAKRQLEIELIEDKLAAIGARIMRPYEHWNEDERYMEYMETRSDY